MKYKTKTTILSTVAIFMALSPIHQAKADGGDVLGTLLGAAGGAVVGSNIGKGNGRTAAIAVGTLFGAAVGQSVGKSVDTTNSYSRKHRTSKRYSSSSRYYSSPYHAKPVYRQPDYVIPHHRPVAYQPPVSMNVQPVNYASYTNVVQTSTSQAYCREFIQTVNIGGRQQEGYGIACRQPDGAWEIQK